MKKPVIKSRSFRSDELMDIARRLEMYDAVFSQLWQVGRPRFTSEVNTAAVAFDKTGQCLELLVNEEFWNARTPVQQDWLICHEMLHVILEHGRRAKDANRANDLANNTAMDIVVNELCVRGFGFKKDEIDAKREFVWLENTFPNRPDVLPNQTYEYYLTKLPQVQTPMSGDSGGKKGSGAGKIMDDHSKLPTDADLKDMAEQVASRLSEEEREKLKQRLGQEGKETEKPSSAAGSESGGFMQVMGKVRVAPKRKWEGLVKHFLKQMEEEGMHESWVQPNRRLMAVNGSGGHTDVILPAEVMTEGKEKTRALVYLFLDTSGSCAHLAARFWRLAMSIPKDRFEVRMRCFDTRVYEVDPKVRKLYGFGGTCFRPIEQHIQQERKGTGPYPDGVFLITDGEAYDRVAPERAERWHVLLTPHGNKGCFTGAVNFHDLAKFE